VETAKITDVLTNRIREIGSVCDLHTHFKFSNFEMTILDSRIQKSLVRALKSVFNMDVYLKRSPSPIGKNKYKQVTCSY